MIYTTTGLAYLSIFVVLSYLIYRFFVYFQKERTTLSKLFFLFIFPFWILAIIKIIGGLFFAENPAFLEFTVDAAAFLETVGLAIGAYLIIYVALPRISPWLGFSLVLSLGLLATALTAFVSFQPFMESSGAINWDYDAFSWPLVFLRTFVFLIVFLPLILTYKRLLKSPDLSVRDKARKSMVFFIVGVFMVVIDFIFIKTFHLGAVWRDFGLGALSLLLFFAVAKKSQKLNE